jgi:zinc transporter, ZIP family
MVEAGLWGLAAASSLVLGAVVAFVARVPDRVQGLILAFGAGILFGAVAYELVEDAVETSMTGLDVAVGFAAGALVFFAGSVAIDWLSAEVGGIGLASRRDPRSGGLATVLGAVLDGIPESIVLGLSLVPGAGVAFPVLVAIFLSNVPESLSATEDLLAGGFTRVRVVGLWLLVALASAAAAGIGFALLDTAPLSLTVGMQAFAAGAILAMLAESMIPEAYEIGGRPVGLATALGFAVAAYLALAG